MATKTIGTNATNSLTAVAYLAGIGSLLPADVATINQIKDDINPTHPLVPGAFTVQGQLYIPRRGFLKIIPGDYVAIDSQGWPVLISGNSAANGPWTHS